MQNIVTVDQVKKKKTIRFLTLFEMKFIFHQLKTSQMIIWVYFRKRVTAYMFMTPH